MNLQPIRLKQLREERHLTQRELGELLNVSMRQYLRYEKGEQEPNLAGWIFLADLYNVSLDYLVGRSDKRERQ